MQCSGNLTEQEQDEFWMAYALELADRAEQLDEVPVGAVLVADGKLIAEGWNQVITLNDPTAHAEVVALRAAGKQLQNYRLIDTTLYVTLEPCPMCSGALVHARVKRVVYGASDYRTGSAGTVFQLLQAQELNHQCEIQSDILQARCVEKIQAFFRGRRLAQKQAKLNSKGKSGN